MRRAGLLTLSLCVVACASSGGSSASSSTPSASSVPADLPTEPVADAVRRQLAESAAAQSDLQWADLHPAQQALIPKDALAACRAKNPAYVIKGIDILATTPIHMTIPGTSTDADGTAVIITLTLPGSGTDRKQTSTYFEFPVDGKWRSTVDWGDVSTIASGCK